MFYNDKSQSYTSPPNQHPTPNPSLSKGGELQISKYYWKYKDAQGNFHHNSHEFKQRVRKLRSNQTPAEQILWQRIRKKQIDDHRFNRQFPVNNYIIDFFCRSKKLAIEVDGSIHKNNNIHKYDLLRQKELETLGIRFMRFTNEEIFKDIDTVLNKIKSHLKTLP